MVKLPDTTDAEVKERTPRPKLTPEQLAEPLKRTRGEHINEMVAIARTIKEYIRGQFAPLSDRVRDLESRIEMLEQRLEK